MRLHPVALVLTFVLLIVLGACGSSNGAEQYYKDGLELHVQEQFIGAVAKYDLAIQDDDEFAPAYISKGIALFTLGRHEDAAKVLTSALRIAPESAPALFYRGRAWGALELFDLAVQDMTEVIRLNPRHSGAYANRTILYSLLGQEDEARIDFDAAVQLGTDAEDLESAIEQEMLLRGVSK